MVGVIYRSTPYLIDQTRTKNTALEFYDFLINALGFPMPFKVCLHQDAPIVVVALLGYIPPALAILTAVIYGFW